jgi:hypothetical protein
MSFYMTHTPTCISSNTLTCIPCLHANLHTQLHTNLHIKFTHKLAHQVNLHIKRLLHKDYF